MEKRMPISGSWVVHQSSKQPLGHGGHHLTPRLPCRRLQIFSFDSSIWTLHVAALKDLRDWSSSASSAQDYPRERPGLVLPGP